MSELAIRVDGLSKRYQIGRLQRRQERLRDVLTDHWTAMWSRLKGQGSDQSSDADDIIWAVKDLSFQVNRGEIIGIIGRNGAGKSTLLKVLSRITRPTSGSAEIHGRIGSLLEVGTGFHAELTGRENVYLNGAILGMKKAEIDRKFDEIVAFAEIEKFLDTPVKRYSSGMYVRLAFAVAAHLEPEILLVDEVLAVGDTAFQKKCLGKMRETGHAGKTVMVVSHNMQTVANICHRALWLNHGGCIADGGVEDVISAYEKSSSSNSAHDNRFRRDPQPVGKAWIDWVEIKDDNGTFRTVFENGEYLNLFAGICGELPVATYFEWVLVSEWGYPASSGATYFKANNFQLPTPSGTLRVRIGPLPLAQGRYSLMIRLGEHSGWGHLDSWEDVTGITVSNCLTEPGGMVFDSRRGVVYIPQEYGDGDA